MSEGLRFNDGKTRHDLVPAFAQEQYAKVLTKGAEKYAERNWEKGMDWTKVIASMKRHILAIERGEDFDPDDGLLHSAHAMCNAAFLTEYYKIHPEFDNRIIHYPGVKRIALDVDDVLADFTGAWSHRFGIDRPAFWKFDRKSREKWIDLVQDKDFWMNIKPKIDPGKLPFEPVLYVTARTIPLEWTEEWLDNNGFASAKVVSSSQKAKVLKEHNIDIFVDDKYKTFVEVTQSGILCYLMDAVHNQRYNVGHKRLYSLDKIFDRI